MIAVDEAVQRILNAFTVISAETVNLTEASGRVLADPVVAGFDQPPEAMSSMDGYAARSIDAAIGARLSVIGEAPAGKPFGGQTGEMQAVRIFTGGVVPAGADSVILQEDVERTGNVIVLREAAKPGENIRARGLDFREGELLVEAGKKLTPRDIAVIAAADLPNVSVRRKPRVAIFATGDELTRPGEPRKQGGVVASSTFAIQAMIRNWGGEPLDCGILRDRIEEFASVPERAAGADLIVTQGGASVGDHDLVQSAMRQLGFVLDFWKIAMRPGKPSIFGRVHGTPVIGLPGNPVSAMVCSELFIRPAIAKMLGCPFSQQITTAVLGTSLPANGKRQDYVRARIEIRQGQTFAVPFRLQDSSTQKIFARSHALIIRKPDAAPAQSGEIVDVLLLDE